MMIYLFPSNNSYNYYATYKNYLPNRLIFNEPLVTDLLNIYGTICMQSAEIDPSKVSFSPRTHNSRINDEARGVIKSDVQIYL